MKLPEDYIESMRKLLGEEELQNYLDCFDAPRTYGLRVNTGKISVATFLKRTPFHLTPVPWVENGFYYDPEEGVTKHPDYYAGLYYIQEPSAMVPASRLPIEEGDRVLDLGCGSGILSIAALVLGAERASAVDIDPKAVDVAYENAALNGIGKDRYTVRAGDVLTDRALAAELAQERYQLVLANIVADVIIPLAPQVPGLLAEGGVFLCSGILDSRAHEVEEALARSGLRVTRKRERNGWAALEAVLA